jgi:hypothetical protein
MGSLANIVCDDRDIKIRVDINVITRLRIPTERRVVAACFKGMPLLVKLQGVRPAKQREESHEHHSQRTARHAGGGVSLVRGENVAWDVPGGRWAVGEGEGLYIQ